jgi:hypothetical protein
MGLKLWKHNQDRQTAEDHIIVFSSAGLAKVRPIFFEPYKTIRTDKGKSIRKVDAQNHGSKAVLMRP